MSNIKVLLVDDEMEFAETLAERLRLRSFEVNVTSRADEAFEMLEAGLRPDVVLLDIKMPGLDGFDALAELKSRDSGMEVILVTGHGEAASSIEGMKRGAFDYLMKPIDIAELIVKIEQAAARKHERETHGDRQAGQ